MAFWAKQPNELKPFGPEKIEEIGFLPIGVWGGSLDEHLPGGERKRDGNGKLECAASLMAKRIGCDRNPVVARMLPYVLASDTELRGSQFELPNLLKTMNMAHKDCHVTYAWAKKAFAGIHRYGEGFFTEGVRPGAGKRLSDFLVTWLLATFAETECPEIKKHPADYAVFGVPDEFFLRLGISRDDCNSHPITSIAAKFDLIDDVALGKFITAAAKRRGKVCGSIFELHNLLDLLGATGDAPSELWDFSSKIFDAIWNRGLAFAEGSATDYANAKIISLPVASENWKGLRQVKCVIGHSDAESFAPLARSTEHGCGAAIVVQGKSNGNVVIQTDKVRMLRGLGDVISILRVEEAKAENKKAGRKVRDIPKDPMMLSVPGDMSGCEKWHGFINGRAIFNGSNTHDAPPTLIPLERVGELVQIGFDPTRFEPSREGSCRIGVCTSTAMTPCPWYDWQLERCCNVRQRMTHRKTVGHTAG